MYLRFIFCNMITRVSAQHGNPVQVPTQTFRLQKPFAAVRTGVGKVFAKVFVKVFVRKGVRKSNILKTIENIFMFLYLCVY